MNLFFIYLGIHVGITIIVLFGYLLLSIEANYYDNCLRGIVDTKRMLSWKDTEYIALVTLLSLCPILNILIVLGLLIFFIDLQIKKRKLALQIT